MAVGEAIKKLSYTSLADQCYFIYLKFYIHVTVRMALHLMRRSVTVAFIWPVCSVEKLLYFTACLTCCFTLTTQQEQKAA